MAREAAANKKTQAVRFNWRLTFGILAVGAIAVSTAVAGYRASLYVASDQQFRLSRDHKDALTILGLTRSEERRVGKECRSRWSPDHSSRRRHTRCLSDWSSDVCSSDLRASLYVASDQQFRLSRDHKDALTILGLT